MTHALSDEDRRFAADFAACRIEPGAFNHRAHVQLAYIYLAEQDTETALSSMRRALLAFIQHHQIPVAKYHETLTKAWILAVRHFMAITPSSSSSASFIASNPQLLDPAIMMTHYSAEVLFSPEARARFVEPNLDVIPRHDAPPRPARDR